MSLLKYIELVLTREKPRWSGSPFFSQGTPQGGVLEGAKEISGAEGNK